MLLILRKIILNLLILFILSALFISGYLLSNPDFFPIKHVRIEGNFKFIGEQNLQKLVLPFVQDSFFTVKVARIRAELLSDPWLQKVSIKRVWPDSLVIIAKEREPVAIFNEKYFFASDSTLLPYKLSEYNLKLPILNAEHSQAKTIFDYWQRLSNILKRKNFFVKRLMFSNRGAIDCELNNNLLLRLGVIKQEERLTSFMKVYDMVLQRYKEPIRYVDLRYTNGVAIGY